jgi:hypothetical protein
VNILNDPNLVNDWLGGVYRDGCSLQPSCFTCALPACRYELAPGQAKAALELARLTALMSDDRTLGEAAAEMGISIRTAYRLRRGQGTGDRGQ